MQREATDREKTLVVGLGKTGLSCVRYLAANGVVAAVADSREHPPGLDELRQEFPDTALFLGEFQSSVFEAADRLVLSPGVPLALPVIQSALAKGIPVVGDIELFAQAVKAPVAAITGSNGKSTVTTMLGEMARRAARAVKVGGNLGEPALDLLDPDADLYLLELSSFQLETTYSLKPKVAVTLNISADHMDRYRDLEHYAQTKASIYRDAEVCVYNRDDAVVMAMREGQGRALYFTLDEAVESDTFGLARRDGELWLCCGKEPLVAASALKVPGRHNLANALASLALGAALDLPMEAMVSGLIDFRGLPHRTQFVAELNGVSWFNDSKGTNVGACVAALVGFGADSAQGQTVLIAGGDGKGADFAPLKGAVEKYARAVVLIGRDAALIENALQGVVPVVHAGSMTEAVDLAADLAQRGDQVLLSPACASFDMYRNYQERGELFMDAVRGLLP